MTGYSGTPLAKKLGFKPGMTMRIVDAPTEYRDWLTDLPDDCRLSARSKPPFQAVHLFSMTCAQLQQQLPRLREQLQADGFLWVSWPKRAAKVPTDITEDTVRALALPLGFVDIKVCAVNEVWSGLKLVIRKSERP